MTSIQAENTIPTNPTPEMISYVVSIERFADMEDESMIAPRRMNAAVRTVNSAAWQMNVYCITLAACE